MHTVPEDPPPPEWSSELTDPPVRVGFRLDPAGATLDFVLEWRGSGAAYLAYRGDRSARRSAEYDVVARLDGRRLPDPSGGGGALGGPATATEIRAGSPLVEQLDLAGWATLPPTPVGELVVRCRRRLGIGATPDLALAAHPVVVEAELRVLLG